MFEHWVRSQATCAICCGLDDQASNWLVFTWPCPSSRFRQNTLASFFSLLRSSLALALHYNQHSLVSREVEKVESKFNSKSTVLPCCTLYAAPQISIDSIEQNLIVFGRNYDAIKFLAAQLSRLLFLAEQQERQESEVVRTYCRSAPHDPTHNYTSG